MSTDFDSYYPFDSGSGADAREAEWYKMARLWQITSVVGGVGNECEVTADGGGMSVDVDTGQVWVEGFFGELTSSKTLTISTAHATLNRIDSVVARLDRTNSVIVVDVVAGTPASSPSPTTLTQTSTTYEMLLAYVYVDAAVTVINLVDVYDQRNVVAPGAGSTGDTIELLTLTGSLSLMDADAKWQLLDPDGSDRTVVLPAEGTNNHPFYIANIGGDGERITVEDDGGASEYYIDNNKMALFVPDKSSQWWVHHIEPISVFPTSVVLYSFAGYSTAQIQDTDAWSPDTWTAKTDYPIFVQYARAATLGSVAIICGGSSSGSYTQTVYEYSPDTFTLKTSLPSPARGRHGFAAFENKAYAFYGTGAVTYQDCDEYFANAWTSKTDGPSPIRREVRGMGLTTGVYSSGGYDGSVSLSDHDEYNPDTWVSRSNMTATRRDCVTGEIGYQGYVAGGLTSPSSQNERYSVDTWSTRTNMPSPARGGAGSGSFDQAYSVVGGSNGSAALQDNDQYIEDSWASKTDLPSPARMYNAATVI